MNKMKEALQKITTSKHNPSFRYVLDYGREFHQEPFTNEERRKIRYAIRKLKPKSGWCHVNAARLWMLDHDFKYCEGYVSQRSDEIVYPLYHSFNAINEKLVDITPDTRYHYFGVIFKNESASNYFEKEKCLSIIEDYEHDHKFLRSVGYIK